MSYNEYGNWNCSRCGQTDNTGGFCKNCGTPRNGAVNNMVPQNGGKDDPKANMLCILSLICMYGIPLIMGILISVIMPFIQRGSSDPHAYRDGVKTLVPLIDIFSSVMGLAVLAGLILMIVVRVKYPKNTFGKVIMWIFIIQVVLSVIGALILIFAVARMCGADMNSMWDSCKNIGTAYAGQVLQLIRCIG